MDARNQTPRIGPAETGLIHAHAVDPHVRPILDRQIDSLGFHISTYDTLAAGTVPPVPLKIRNDHELLLIPAKFSQHAIRQNECFVIPCGFEGWFQAVDRGLQRVLVRRRRRAGATRFH